MQHELALLRRVHKYENEKKETITRRLSGDVPVNLEYVHVRGLDPFIRYVYMPTRAYIMHNIILLYEHERYDDGQRGELVGPVRDGPSVVSNL
jgi:hypothetical protein